jgi:hypothetical protein
MWWQVITRQRVMYPDGFVLKARQDHPRQHDSMNLEQEKQKY